MTTEGITLVDDGAASVVEAAVSDRGITLGEEAARRLRGGAPGPRELAALAAALGRPLAVDAAERAAYLGVGARERSRPLAALEAPDFTLPDLEGRPHTLSAHRGRKVLLVAYSSW